MNPNEQQKISSSSTLEVLGALWLKDTLEKILGNTQKLMASADEAREQIAGVAANVAEIGVEVDALLVKIDELIAAAQNTVPDDIMEKLVALKAQAQVVDDKVPNP